MRLMKTFLALGALLALSAFNVSPALADKAMAVTTCAAESYTAGRPSDITIKTDGSLCTSGSSTLPTGAATSAKQDTGNTSLASILASIGAAADAAWTSGSGSVIAILKAIDGHVDGLETSASSIDTKLSSQATAANQTTPQAPVAPATATATKSVLAGGQYNSTKPTFTDGQQGSAQFDSRGNLMVTLAVADTTNAPFFGTPTDGVTNTSALRIQQNLYNGSTYDRPFTCPLSAVINVTAANTTELVALTASQVIRVCSFVITESLAGTSTFVYGTGTNCATGQTALTGAMQLVTGGNMPMSGMNGSLFRTASANALCLTAVTGNITGFVTYAKY